MEEDQRRKDNLGIIGYDHSAAALLKIYQLTRRFNDDFSILLANLSRHIPNQAPKK